MLDKDTLSFILENYTHPIEEISLNLDQYCDNESVSLELMDGWISSTANQSDGDLRSPTNYIGLGTFYF